MAAQPALPDPAAPPVEQPAPDDEVVLLDHYGRPAGTAAKSTVHHGATPLHLAFSCYVLDEDGRVLLTRRASTKRTFPGVWTNACCGHPLPAESLHDATRRRLRFELGLQASRLEIALPDFAYRAQMADGTVEKELCPVLVALVDGEPSLNPAEADDCGWVEWPELVTRARHRPDSLSPWSVRQVRRLAELTESPLAWLHAQPRGAEAAADPLELVVDPLEPVAGLVNGVLEGFIAERSRELAELDGAAAALSAAVAALLDAGGKRMRPAFVYWGHRAGGAPHGAAIAGPAAATELLHTFALIHDDVMDRSVTRRGLPTAHRRFATEHEQARWRGEPGWFGTSAAILAGDLAAVWADQLMTAGKWPPALAVRAQQVFATLRSEVTAGQFLDLRLAADDAAGEAEALRVALLKSGRYTVTRPLELGAVLAGAGSQVLAALAGYGDAVGLAFQLRDDLLGLVGEPGLTGKSRSEDLCEGKRTLPVLRALELAPPRHAQWLRSALARPDLDELDAERCRAIILDSGAVASVEALIGALHRQATAALGAVPEPAASALRRLGWMAAYRSH